MTAIDIIAQTTLGLLLMLIGIHLLTVKPKPKNTKHCPKCDNEHLVLIRSQDHKLCSDCGGLVIPWQLDDDQERLQ